MSYLFLIGTQPIIKNLLGKQQEDPQSKHDGFTNHEFISAHSLPSLHLLSC